jgi:8-oxo-dGTP diphosphatase
MGLFSRFQVPDAAWGLVKETARHLLRRPVVGLVALARAPDGRVVLIRRGDTGGWALPGGTLEWGETLRTSLERELHEEAGVDLLQAGELLGVYSAPWRDPRFHAVTVVVGAQVTDVVRPPMNSLEIREVALFRDDEVPAALSHGLTEVLANALRGRPTWE